MSPPVTPGADPGSWAELDRRLVGRLCRPGSDGYARATTPLNATARQEPAAVAQVACTEDVAACLRWASDQGTPVRVQASGHGAARDIGADTLLVDTSALDDVQVDAGARTVRVGAGARVGAVNAAAWRHGLLFPGGTAADVAVTGYVGWGGVGWLTRPHGLASSALLSVDVVDASGQVRHADDEHDQDVLWAYRGGGGVGVATTLTFRLFPAEHLWAGYALWPASALDAVASAWGAAVPSLHPALTTSLALLHAPDAPTVPPALRGQPVVHMSAASIAGPDAGRSLLTALADAPAASVSTFGPCDADRLAGVHLDPPGPVPAVGVGRWLTADVAAHAAEVLACAGTTTSSPVAELELRHVAAPASTVPGAETSAPGPFLLHATGAGPDAHTRNVTQQALDAVLVAVSAYDTGRSAPAFCDGQTDVASALDPDALERLRTLRAHLDPRGLIGPARVLS